MRQLSLWDPRKEERLSKPEMYFPEPVAADGALTILSLQYSLVPVSGWVEVCFLTVYRPPHHHEILPLDQSAWVNPATIETVLMSSVHETAWGFGPKHAAGCNGEGEYASFDLRDYRDYDRILVAIRSREGGAK